MESRPFLTDGDDEEPDHGRITSTCLHAEVRFGTQACLAVRLAGKGKRTEGREIKSNRKDRQGLPELSLLEDAMNAKDAKKTTDLHRETNIFSALFAPVALFHITRKVLCELCV